MADIELQKYISIFEKRKLTEAKAEYEDSGEFTDEFYTVVEIINSKRFAAWMKITDENYSTQCVPAYKELKAALKKVVDEIEAADE